MTHDTAKAIAAYEKLTKVNPDDLDAQFALATLYKNANKFDEAKKYCLRCWPPIRRT